MATIFRKSTKGQLEIETRATRLAPKFRGLLILVDGRRSDEELVKLMPLAGAEALQALAEGGYIEAIGHTAEPAPAPAQPPAPERKSTTTVVLGFEQRRREAVRQLLEVVGPLGEALAMRMERAKGPEDFGPLVDTAAKVVANTRGREAAEDYLRRFGQT